MPHLLDEPQGEQNLTRGADGAEENSVELLQLLKPARRNVIPMLLVGFTAPIDVLPIKRECPQRHR